LRDFGVKKGVISTTDLDTKRLIRKARDSESIVGVDLVKQVSCREPYEFKEVLPRDFVWPRTGCAAAGQRKKRKSYSVVCIDGGIKLNILRKLCQHGFRPTVVPARTNAREILERKPNAVFLSNGPGDPAAVTYLIDTVRDLIGKKPLFGICLGHQIIALALGGETFKLKFGHRGGNHPVMDLRTKRVEITSQNHGFSVDPDSLPKGEVDLTHVNLNDRTNEGFRHKKFPLFAVQYHPENSPGPHDSDYLFDRFYHMVDREVW